MSAIWYCIGGCSLTAALFVAADVCRALEIEPTATRRLDDDEKSALRLTQTSSNGVEQGRDVTVVNEPGLYSLVLGSRKPEAKSFKRWITHEVIPSIRRHGAYATDSTIDRIIDDPDFGIRLLGQLKQEREARRALDTKKEMQRTGERESAPHSSHAASLYGSIAQACTAVNPRPDWEALTRGRADPLTVMLGYLSLQIQGLVVI